MAQKGFFEDALKRFCNEKFGADCWVDGNFSENIRSGTLEFSIVWDDAERYAPRITLELLEEISLMLGTCDISFSPLPVTRGPLDEREPGIRFIARQVAFICPG